MLFSIQPLLLLSFFLAAVMSTTPVRAQQELPLYPQAVPNSKNEPRYKEYTRQGDNGLHYVYKVSQPTITVFVPKQVKPNGTSVIICPGGGYQLLAIDHEGYEMARRFNAEGITAFVLKYRLPSDSIMVDKTIGPLQDAQQAILFVRENAAQWNLDTRKIGLLGSSAGGHLASTAGTHFTTPVIENKKGTSLRPDFLVLLYPVISFGQLAHTSSAKNLLGEDLSEERTNFYSNEMQVTRETPPTFLLHAGDDSIVKVKNSLLFYEALLASKVPAEMHLYQKGGHGFGLHNPTTEHDWFGSLVTWMKSAGFTR